MKQEKPQKDILGHRKNLAFLYLFSFCMLPSLTYAAPTEVILFPEAARITEVTKTRLLPEGKDLRKAMIALPGKTDPDSFTVELPQNAQLKIEDLIWRRVARDESIKVKELHNRIKTLKDEKNSLEATLLSLDAQIQFWQQQIKAKAKSSEASAVASAIGKNIRKIHQEKLNLGPEIPKLDKKIKELEEVLKLSGAGSQYMWEGTIFLSGVSTGDATLTYRYTLTGCGWLPLYRLDAQPQAGEIRFAREAEIWQNSGENWNDVKIELSTMQTPTSFTPDDMTPWVITPRSKIAQETKQEPTQGKKMKGKQPADTLKMAAQTSLAGIAPQNDEALPPARQGALVILNAGRKTVSSGSRHKIHISEEIWNADFGYLALPSRNPQAFISASFHFPEAREIPPGNAVFFHDGAMLGKKTFALSGQEGILFFGQDPLVAVVPHLLSKQDDNGSGKEKKSYRRQWRFEAQNSHSFPIRLRIEEPLPISADGSIKVTLNYAPPPSEQRQKSLIWEIDLTAGEKRSIHFGMEVEAPADREIIF